MEGGREARKGGFGEVLQTSDSTINESNGGLPNLYFLNNMMNIICCWVKEERRERVRIIRVSDSGTRRICCSLPLGRVVCRGV